MFDNPTMQPRISAGDEPPFHELDEYRFQKLCRDLFVKEPDITWATVYGVRGETQQGIDVLARRRLDDSIEVGQCKRYKEFSPAQIRAASDEFFAYWAYWQTQRVRRFVLFVTADISSRQHLAAIDEQRARFQSLGIEYVPWPPDMLQNKLRDHPTIVAAYVDAPEYWVRKICGAIGPNPWPDLLPRAPGIAAGSVAFYREQIEALATRLSSETERQLDEMKSVWREGRKEAVRLWLYQVRSDQIVWERLPPSIRARILRFEARVKLDLTHDTYHATQLADEADRLAPNDPDYITQAFIAFYEHDIERALACIADSDDAKHANLRASFLLELGRIDEARAMLQRAEAALGPNDETFRLSALLALVIGDLDQAQLDAQRALELAPRWEAVRLADALIHYYSALSPAVLPDRILPAPEPVNWAFVKQDDASLARLQAAAATFGDLAELAYDSTARRRHLIWRMAALACHPDTQDAGATLCQSLLKDTPGDGALIIWALMREYPLNLEAIEKPIERRLRVGEASPQDVLVLLQCHMVRNQTQRAINLLKRNRWLFDQHQALWEIKHLQLRITKGDRKAIAAALAPVEETEASLDLKAFALRANAQRTRAWQPLHDHLVHCVAVTGAAEYLMELCDLLASQSQWPELAERAEQLTATVGTAAAIRLAAFGLFNVGHYQACLTLLDNHQDAFRQRELTPPLNRMRVLSLLQLGQLSKAVRYAEQLVQISPTIENELLLVDVHVSRGDMLQVTLVARRLRDNSDLPAEQAFRLSALTHHEDLRLAQALWRRAVQMPLPDDLVGLAHTIGAQLGLDAELRTLTVRLVELGASGRGGIQAFSIPDLLAFAQKRHEQHAEVGELYRKGNAPIHVVAEIFNIPLIDLYHRWLTAKEMAISAWSHQPLLARHGSRSLLPGFPDSPPTWRLHVDITALLLAAHVEILDIIEQTFKPLHIPAAVIQALLTMRDHLTHHQPSQLAACRHIATLINRGRLHVLNRDPSDSTLDEALVRECGGAWAALFAQARGRDGYVVDFLPLRRPDLSAEPAAIPHEAARHVTNCRAIVDSLRQHGPLTEVAYAATIDALGEIGHQVTDAPIPAPEAILFCHANIPEVLADADVLDMITARYRVFIEQDEHERVMGTLRYEEQRQEDKAWLDDLIRRITRGLETDIYQTIPESSAERADREEDPHGVFSRCVTSLFAYPVQPDDVIWIDDRFINAYLYRNTVSIVGISEVLKAAVSTSALTVDQYYVVLSRMRAADVRFIPIESDEIVYALSRARVDGQGRVIETEHLIHLRRYVARCLLGGEILQWPPLPARTPPYPSEEGEVAFVLGLHHALEDAMLTIWSAETDLDLCRTRSTWIADTLLFDALMARTVLGLRTDEDQQLSLIATHLAGLLLRTWNIQRSTLDEAEAARHAFHEWMERRLIVPRLTAEPSLASAIADMLKLRLSHMLDDPPAEIPAQLLAISLHDYMESLPTVIRAAIQSDHAFMERLGVVFHDVVQFDDLTFEPVTFWSVLETVVNGQPASIVPINSETPVRFELVEDIGSSILAYKHPSTHTPRLNKDAALLLLTSAALTREVILRQNRHWFDCSNDTFEQVLVAIVTQPDPQQRVETVVTWRKEHLAAHYALLEQRIQERQTFRLDELRVPSASGLLRHFRLDSPTASSIRDLTDGTAPILLRELGLEETLDRLTRLPVPLPAAVLDAAAAYSGEDQHLLVKQLLPLSDSPLSMLHLLRILVRLGAEAPAFRRLARRIVSRLIAVLKESTFAAYFALLSWVHEMFDEWEEARAWSPATRIAMAWAHTDKTFRVLYSVGVDPTWMAQTFAAVQRRLVQELFQRDPQVWYDVAHPRQQHPLTFLIAGLAYGLAESAPIILDDQIRVKLEARIFPTIGDVQIPAVVLCMDPTQAPDVLGSFLCGDYGTRIEQLLGSEAAAPFTPDRLTAFVEETIETLRPPGADRHAWLRLSFGLGHLLPAPRLREPLATLLQQLDLVALYRVDTTLGTLTLQTIARQAAALGNAATGQHLCDQLVLVARVLSEIDASEALEQQNGYAELARDRMVQVLEASIHLIIAAHPDQPVVPAYSALLRQLIDANPAAAAICGPFVHHLCNDLPLAQAQYFWSLLIRLRAE